MAELLTQPLIDTQESKTPPTPIEAEGAGLGLEEKREQLLRLYRETHDKLTDLQTRLGKQKQDNQTFTIDHAIFKVKEAIERHNELIVALNGSAPANLDGQIESHEAYLSNTDFFLKSIEDILKKEKEIKEAKDNLAETESLEEPEAETSEKQTERRSRLAEASSAISGLFTGAGNFIKERSLDLLRKRNKEKEDSNENKEYEPTPNDIQQIHLLAVNIIKDDYWTEDERNAEAKSVAAGNPPLAPEQILEKAQADGRPIDEIYSKAIFKYEFNQLTAEASISRENWLERKKREGNGRWKRALRTLGLSATGIVGGTMLRHFFNQQLVSAGVASAHGVSAGSGALAGLAVGGVVGGIRGYISGREKTYNGQSIVAMVEKGRKDNSITREAALGLYERLLRENKAIGNEEAVYSLIQAIAEQKANEELSNAKDILAPVEGESREDRDKRLARALIVMNNSRTQARGSEKERNEAIQNFINERRKAHGKEVLKSSVTGALQWAALGGVIGYVFTAPGIQSMINAETVSNQPVHLNAENIKEAAAEVRELVAQTGSAKEYILQQNYNMKDLLVALKEDPLLAKHIGYALKIDMAKEFGGKTVHEMAQLFANIAPENEYGARGLFHLLSHPDVHASHWEEFMKIASNAKGSAMDYTLRLIHGGTTGAFTGGAMPGGEYSDAMSESMRTWLTGHTPHTFLGLETPWFPFAASILTSSEAKEVQEAGGRNKLEEKLNKAKTELGIGKIEAKETTPRSNFETKVIKFDKRLFNDDGTPTNNKGLQPKLAQFKQQMYGQHGHFIFAPDPKDRDKLKAFRVWTKGGRFARPEQPFDTANTREVQGLSGETVPNQHNEDWNTHLSQGLIRVIKYDLDEVFAAPSTAKTGEKYFQTLVGQPHQVSKSGGQTSLEKTGDHAHWNTEKKLEGSPSYLNVADAFNITGRDMQQLFVSPLEADMYAYALSEGWIRPGEKTNINDLFAAKKIETEATNLKLNVAKNDRDLLLARLNSDPAGDARGPDEIENIRNGIVDNANKLIGDDPNLTKEQALDLALASILKEEQAEEDSPSPDEPEDEATAVDSIEMKFYTDLARKHELESKSSYEQSISRALEKLKSTEGIVELKNGLPTVVIPDLHGRRDFLSGVLAQKLEEHGPTVFDLLKDHRLNVVCLGDGMHSEERGAERWEKAGDSYQAGDKEEAYTLLDEEMLESLGTMKMVMELKHQFPDNFHFIRGNHDDIKGTFKKYVQRVRGGESHLVREWVKSRFGEDFIDTFAEFEDWLPLMVVGEGFVATHAAPSEAIAREKISGRDPVISGKEPGTSGHHGGLTWTDNTKDQTSEEYIEETLRNVGALGSTWVIGHRPVHENSGLYREQFGGNLIQINNPSEMVYAVVPAGEKIVPSRDIHKLPPS